MKCSIKFGAIALVAGGFGVLQMIGCLGTAGTGSPGEATAAPEETSDRASTEEAVASSEQPLLSCGHESGCCCDDCCVDGSWCVWRALACNVCRKPPAPDSYVLKQYC
jgi:hypothetical protein